MVVASIEIGTNTIKLLICKNRRTIYQDMKITRLGEKLYNTGILYKDAIKRTLRGLKNFMDICSRYSVKRVIAIATESLRFAKNSDEFVKKAKSQLDIDIMILTSKMEARMGFMGACYSRANIDKIAVIDIGGASTEICTLENEEFFTKCIKIGSVVITEKFLKSDPPEPFHIQMAKKFVKEKLRRIYIPVEGKRLIGIGGTITSLVGMIKGSFTFNRIHNRVLKIGEIEKIYDDVCFMPVAERVKKYKLELGRADIIVAGVLILIEVMHRFDKDSITVSTRGVRHGVFI
jgi:exopolyphosphatase/guanosine-5'-triphosphate,3'-diphosphate pyrophosphatase